MSDLETLSNGSKLIIGDANKIRAEISRLTKIQQQLSNIYEELQEELDNEKFNKGVLGAIPWLGTVASIFIPGGFLIDAAISAGSGLLANKLGDPDKEHTLIEWVEIFEDLINWVDSLKELAENLLVDSGFFAALETERKHPILSEKFRQIDENLSINLEFGDEPTLKQQLQQIKKAQQDLKEIQPQIDKILKVYQNSENRVELIKGLLIFFGDTVFAIDWIDDEEGLIISFGEQGVPKVSEVTVIGECFSIKEKANSLVLQANNLRGQAEQSIRHLEEERRRLEAEEKRRIEEEHRRLEAEEQRQRETTPIKIQNEQIKPLVKPIRFPIKALLAASTVAALGYAGWTSGIATPQIQQLLNNLQLSQNTDELKPNYQLQTSANLETTKKPNPEQETSVNLEAIQKPNPEQEAATNLETAQKLAMEAAVMTQNSPHPLEIWQKSQAKWQEAVNVLEAIPENLAISAKAKEKLANYRINFTAISNRIITEEKASTNLETAQKLAMEASVMMQNSSQSAEIWQQAKAKLQEAISLLEAIPNNTFVSAQVKNNLLIYRTNYAVVSQK